MIFELPPGGTGSDTFVLHNDGCAPLQWQIMERAASGVIYGLREESASPSRPAIDWSKPHVPGRLIVGIEPGLQAVQRAGVHEQAGAKLVESFRVVSADIVKVDTGTDLKSIAAKYADMPGVTYVEPDYIVSAFSTPNDPMFPSQWGLNNTGQTGGAIDADIDASEAWDTCVGDRGDRGCRDRHRYLLHSSGPGCEHVGEYGRSGRQLR